MQTQLIYFDAESGFARSPQDHAAVQSINASAQQTRPSVLFKPALSYCDGNWHAKYGDFSAVGSTPDEAMKAFDKAWTK